MIKFDLNQGTVEWMEARLAIPTASGFSNIVTPSGAKSKSADGYLAELLAEYHTGIPKIVPQSIWMARGIELEPEARNLYSFVTEQDVEETGLIYKDYSFNIACSPDGLLKDKGLEIKCPKLSTHLAYMIKQECPPEYKAQVQGCMWVSGLTKWDFFSYHPDAKPFLITVEKDEKWHDNFTKYIDDFLIRLERFKKQL